MGTDLGTLAESIASRVATLLGPGVEVTGRAEPPNFYFEAHWPSDRVAKMLTHQTSPEAIAALFANEDSGYRPETP